MFSENNNTIIEVREIEDCYSPSEIDYAKKTVNDVKSTLKRNSYSRENVIEIAARALSNIDFFNKYKKDLQNTYKTGLQDFFNPIRIVKNLKFTSDYVRFIKAYQLVDYAYDKLY